MVCLHVTALQVSMPCNVGIVVAVGSKSDMAATPRFEAVDEVAVFTTQRARPCSVESSQRASAELSLFESKSNVVIS